eukprot:5535951-Prymnesium_polylepis.1
MLFVRLERGVIPTARVPSHTATPRRAHRAHDACPAASPWAIPARSRTARCSGKARAPARTGRLSRSSARLLRSQNSSHRSLR